MKTINKQPIKTTGFEGNDSGKIPHFLRRFFLISFLLITCVYLQGQAYYYVSSNKANVLSEASGRAAILKSLDKYDNVEVLDKEGDWFEIRIGSTRGYIHKTLLAEGRAVLNKTQYRIGAICRDGTKSSATGRGACSHHGGVAQWRTQSNISVQVIPN